MSAGDFNFTKRKQLVHTPYVGVIKFSQSPFNNIENISPSIKSTKDINIINTTSKVSIKQNGKVIKSFENLNNENNNKNVLVHNKNSTSNNYDNFKLNIGHKKAASLIYDVEYLNPIVNKCNFNNIKINKKGSDDQSLETTELITNNASNHSNSNLNTNSSNLKGKSNDNISHPDYSLSKIQENIALRRRSHVVNNKLNNKEFINSIISTKNDKRISNKSQYEILINNVKQEKKINYKIEDNLNSISNILINALSNKGFLNSTISNQTSEDFIKSGEKSTSNLLNLSNDTNKLGESLKILENINTKKNLNNTNLSSSNRVIKKKLIEDIKAQENKLIKDNKILNRYCNNNKDKDDITIPDSSQLSCIIKNDVFINTPNINNEDEDNSEDTIDAEATSIISYITKNSKGDYEIPSKFNNKNLATKNEDMNFKEVLIKECNISPIINYTNKSNNLNSRNSNFDNSAKSQNSKHENNVFKEANSSFDSCCCSCKGNKIENDNFNNGKLFTLKFNDKNIKKSNCDNRKEVSFSLMNDNANSNKDHNPEKIIYSFKNENKDPLNNIADKGDENNLHFRVNNKFSFNNLNLTSNKKINDNEIEDASNLKSIKSTNDEKQKAKNIEYIFNLDLKREELIDRRLNKKNISKQKSHISSISNISSKLNSSEIQYFSNGSGNNDNLVSKELDIIALNSNNKNNNKECRNKTNRSNKIAKISKKKTSKLHVTKHNSNYTSAPSILNTASLNSIIDDKFFNSNQEFYRKLKEIKNNKNLFSNKSSNLISPRNNRIKSTFYNPSLNKTETDLNRCLN